MVLQQELPILQRRYRVIHQFEAVCRRRTLGPFDQQDLTILCHQVSPISAIVGVRLNDWPPLISTTCPVTKHSSDISQQAAAATS